MLVSICVEYIYFSPEKKRLKDVLAVGAVATLTTFSDCINKVLCTVQILNKKEVEERGANCHY